MGSVVDFLKFIYPVQTGPDNAFSHCPHHLWLGKLSAVARATSFETSCEQCPVQFQSLKSIGAAWSPHPQDIGVIQNHCSDKLKLLLTIK